MAIKKKVTKKGSSLTALKDPDASRSKPSTNIYLDPSTASLPSPSYTAEELIDTSNGMSSVEVQALRDDFQIESASRTRALWQKQVAALETMDRRRKMAVSTLDEQVRKMSFGEFLQVYRLDKVEALRGVVSQDMRPVPMGQGEQSVRKRKRVVQVSPTHTGSQDEEDVFGTTKKPRAGTSALKPTRRNISSTPTATRTRNGSSAPSSSQAPQPNFIYNSSSLHPALPPTPSVGTGTIKRKPRRGESIVMLSVNDSPLGVFVASEDEEEDGGDGEWDLMERNEASRVEEQGKGKGKAKGKGGKKAVVRKSSRARSSSLSGGGGGGEAFGGPSASAFTYVPPTGAPDFEALLARQKKEMEEAYMTQMRQVLEGTKMSEKERTRLEGKLQAALQTM